MPAGKDALQDEVIVLNKHRNYILNSSLNDDNKKHAIEAVDFLIYLNFNKEKVGEILKSINVVTSSRATLG